jgi:hypothetical protein
MKIKSWIFNQRFSPKNIYLQINNYFQTKITQTENNKIIRIAMKIIKQILDKLSLIKNRSTIFYELVLDYGQKHGSITIQLQPIFEERFYFLPLYSNHKNDSYIESDCSST